MNVSVPDTVTFAGASVVACAGAFSSTLMFELGRGFAGGAIFALVRRLCGFFEWFHLPSLFVEFMHSKIRRHTNIVM